MFVVYQDGFPVVTGSAKECAEVLGVKESTIVWYSTPCCAERERSGRTNRVAVRVDADD